MKKIVGFIGMMAFVLSMTGCGEKKETDYEPVNLRAAYMPNMGALPYW